jgi:hypothetical protein
MRLVGWLEKKGWRHQNDAAVAVMLEKQAQDPRPLHARLQAELDNDSMPGCRFMLVSKAMIAEAIEALRLTAS